MKILKFILENFSNIETAMNSHKLEIDFSKSENKICLIIGKNGSGKSTILSLLNPFATIGNLDVRDGNGLVIEGKRGYKEIHIECDGDVYIIKHFYTPKDKGHSVKSYILKNDIQLNENGNVTSFKEIIKDELGIELDYLKLVRIGSNVTSLIGLSETERKNFMSKLLDEIGVYLTYYKKVNNDLRQLKELISHTVDKLNKLNVTDRVSIAETIARINFQKCNSEQDRIDLNSKISILNHEIEEIPDLMNLKNDLSSVNKSVDKMEKILQNKGSISTDPEYYRQKIQKLNESISSMNTTISAYEILVNNSLTSLDNLYTQKRSYEVQLEKEKNTNLEIQKLSNEEYSIEEKMQFSKLLLKDFVPTYTKGELERFIVFLKTAQEQLSTAYEYGKKPIEKIISILRDNRSVDSFVNKNSIDTSTDESLSVLNKIRQIGVTLNTIEKEKPCGETPCEYKGIMIQLYNLLEERVDTSRKYSEDFLIGVESAWDTIRKVISSFNDYKDFILKLPEDVRIMFRLDNLYNSIENMAMIYDDKVFNNLLSTITEYENYSILEERKHRIMEVRSTIENVSNYDGILSSLKSVDKEIDRLETDKVNYKNKIHDLKDSLRSDINDLETMNDYLDTFVSYDSLKDEQEKLLKYWNTYTDNSSKIREYNSRLSQVSNDIQIQENSLRNWNNILIQYDINKKDLKKYNKLFDEISLVKEALSSKKGIPLYYIFNYLGNVEETTNELLDIAYDGDIYIDKFVITPTEFSIPFYNKGKWIKDVKSASQGELSFLSIALSFALSNQSLKKYNIMLLDEIDGPLDTGNREKFIRVLENQIDRIDSEQNFLITHNDMFSSYPVDIIDLSFENDRSKYPLANYIPVIRK